MSATSKETRMRTVTEQREIVLTLTSDEVAAMARHMAALDADISELEHQAAQVAREFLARIELLHIQRKQLGQTVRAGVIRKTADVQVIFDYERNSVRTFHHGKVIEERVMTDNERQLEMDFRKEPEELYPNL